MTVQAPRAFNREMYHDHPENVFYGTDDGAQDGSFSEFAQIKAHYDNVGPARRDNIHMISVVGGLYGHNFGEKDVSNGSGKTENDLGGVEISFDALPALLGGLSIKQAALWSFNGVDDGLTGRTVASLNLMPLNLIVFRPFLSANFGGVYGEGVQDGLVVGPELGFDITPFGGVTLRAHVAYDYQFRNAGWDEGILWGGLGLGYRF